MPFLGPGGRSRRSAMACGAWADGPAPMTRRRLTRSIVRSISVATSSIPPGHMTRVAANACWESFCDGIQAERCTSPRRFLQLIDNGWPGRPHRADDVFPYEHIVRYTTVSLENLGVSAIDLQQLHVWDDSLTVPDVERGGCRSQAPRSHPVLRYQRQSLGTDERASRCRHGPRRCGPGRVQHL